MNEFLQNTLGMKKKLRSENVVKIKKFQTIFKQLAIDLHLFTFKMFY